MRISDWSSDVCSSDLALAYRTTKQLAADFARDLAASLKALTGTNWTVEASEGEAEPHLLEQEKSAADELRQPVLDTPIVTAAFEAFPVAELADYTLTDIRTA